MQEAMHETMLFWKQKNKQKRRETDESEQAESEERWHRSRSDYNKVSKFVKTPVKTSERTAGNAI